MGETGTTAIEVLTKEELEMLQKFVTDVNSLNNQRAKICLEKELEIRRIQAEFDKKWQFLNLNIQQASENQKQFVVKLGQKYGNDKAFDISTGEIKEQ